jgi:hypothetical protein
VERVSISIRTLALSCAVGVAVFFAAECADLTACSTAIIGYQEVSDHFVVKVVSEGRPVAGLYLELRTLPKHPSIERRLVVTRATDENGSAEFAAVKAGSYTVDVKHNVFPSSTDILVKTHGRKNTDDAITIEWPNIQILHVRAAAGLLNGQVKTGNPLADQMHAVIAPLGEAKLTLVKAASEEMVGSQSTSSSGAFSFVAVAEGLYLLHVKSPENMQTHQIGYDGDVPLAIDFSAQAVSLNLSIYPPMCGSLGYRNEEGAAAQ